MLGSSQLGGRIALPGPQQEQRMRVSATYLFSATPVYTPEPPPSTLSPPWLSPWSRWCGPWMGAGSCWRWCREGVGAAAGC